VGEMTATCCIAGGGPAGMMLGYMLARAGVDVLVLEKHADFLRDFRGDTIHPSTLEVMHELGLIERLLRLPHEKAEGLSVQIGETIVPIADFTHLPTQCRYVAFMPQWDFLNFLAEEGRRYPTFRLVMQANVEGLIEADGRITGVTAETPLGQLAINADLVVGADGRHSTVRQHAGLAVTDLGAPMDVLWFRLPRDDSDPGDSMGRIEAGRMFVMIDRRDYWQCGYVIAKGTFEAIRGAGLPAFRDTVAALAPFARERVAVLQDWDQIKLLTVAVDRMPVWHRPGLLCIGDAAHAMSPIGGVGINLAIQDAVASANLLATPLRERRVTDQVLDEVQRRRQWPVRVTQALQVFMQNRVISNILGRQAPVTPPLIVRLFARFPILRRIPARLIGIGVRPEHVAPTIAMPAKRVR
jgi:2-polyprenyl-6-methoxyphenol hydroxylase-like FAD-dependent oxidoreductase